MAASPLTYSDISPRTNAFAVAELLKRGDANMILEKLGQAYTLPTKSTKTAIFRRYELLALATTPLVEGVTPAGKKPVVTDVSVAVEQFGDFIPFTDVIEDTHEDPVLRENQALLRQQCTETVETLRWNTVKAGTNVFYANGTQRTDVNTPITLALQRQCTMALLAQRGEMLNEMSMSSANYRTEPIEATFTAVCHVHVSNDIRNMDGFIPVKQYASGPKYAGEIGAVEDVRYVRSVLFTPFADAGGAKGAMRSTTGTSADVYPVLYFAKNCFGIVPLKGKSAMTLIVHNPGSAGSADALNQRGTIGWKLWHASVILNDLWLVRAEVAATA